MTPADQLIEIIGGLVQGRALFVALRLGLLDCLETDSLTVPELSSRLHIHERHVRALVAFLSSKGVLTTREGRFRLASDFRHILGKESPFREVIRFECDTSWSALTRLERAMRENHVAFEDPFFSEHLSYEDDLAHQYGFVLAAHGAAERLASAILDAGLRFKCLVDVGCGLGQYAAAILRLTTESKAYLIDRKRVLECATEYLAREEPSLYASGRLAIMLPGIDFFQDSIPARGDMILLSRVLHDWDDAQCRALLKRCRASATENAYLVIHEEILRTDLSGPPYAAINSLYLSYSLTSGGNRTLPEITDLLVETGWSVPQILYFNADRRFSAVYSKVA
jgi:SAM-dependent methyltransferase